MRIGICALCRAEGELQDNHLIPASVYKTLTEPTAPNPNPVLIRSGISYQTSRQAKTYLLCSACEQLLNARGERQIIPLLAKRSQTSPIYELVTQTCADVYLPGIAAYSAAHNTGIPVDSMAHFAMAIFWKASVHSWHAGDGDPLISLGPYQEAVRSYVREPLGQPLPQNMALLIAVLPPPNIPLLLSSPVRGANGNGFHNFRFYVPGIQFILSVGKTVDADVCFVNNPLHPICIHDIADKVNEIPRRMYFRGKAIKKC